MANFKGHFMGAAVASGVLSAGVLALGYINSTEAIVAFVLGIIGGLLPDIDSDNSTPLNMAFTFVSIMGAFFVMFSKSDTYSVIEMVLLWLMVYMFIRIVILELFKKLTVHRGMFHSIPAAILAGFLTTNMFYYFFAQAPFISWVAGFFVTFGYIVHLLLDEFVSVNLMGAKMKKSFGTAMKLYDKNHILTTILVYMAIAVVFYYVPDFSKALSVISSENFYKDFANALVPQGEWFKGLIPKDLL
jgi:membrane-bound metal-dependent hydrolase YbcI (DUF457 family)